MEKSKIKVKIFGTEYALKADTGHEDIKDAATYVDKKMHDISAKMVEQSDMRVAVLTALNIADELLQTRRQIPSELIVKTNKLADILYAALED
jgi:cell division protein ZapA